MTDKLAVLKSYVMWAWMEQFGLTNREKRKYPLIYSLGIDECECLCPLCEQYSTGYHSYSSCSNCLMRNRWTGRNSNELCTCTSKGSFYGELEKFQALSIKEIKLIAGEIANSLWKLYKEMEDK